MSRFIYFGRCWKQKLFPILVFLLQREPDFVVAEHLFSELTPAVFFGFEISPKVCLTGGLQILQEVNPDCNALFKGKDDETFLTILQLDK